MSKTPSYFLLTVDSWQLVDSFLILKWRVYCTFLNLAFSIFTVLCQLDLCCQCWQHFGHDHIVFRTQPQERNFSICLLGLTIATLKICHQIKTSLKLLWLLCFKYTNRALKKLLVQSPKNTNSTLVISWRPPTSYQSSLFYLELCTCLQLMRNLHLK